MELHNSSCLNGYFIYGQFLTPETEPKSNKSSPLAAIIGGVAGAGLLGGFAYYYIKTKKKRRNEE